MATAKKKTAAPPRAAKKKTAAPPRPAKKKSAAPPSPAKKSRIHTLPVASVYPLYVKKAENKGRTKDEVDQVIAWLTGYRGAALQRVLDAKVDFETFFAKAPKMNPKVSLITGIVCGVRVEDIEDPVMRNVRYLDKLVDEIARGKKMESILRA